MLQFARDTLSVFKVIAGTVLLAGVVTGTALAIWQGLTALSRSFH